MSDMILNLDLAGVRPGGTGEHGNSKHQRFLRRRRFLERRGLLKQKQLPPRPPAARRKEQQAQDPQDPGRKNNGQQRTTGQPHSHSFRPRQQPEASSMYSRALASALPRLPGTLRVSIGPGAGRHCLATFAPDKDPSLDVTGRPAPKFPLLQSVNLMSEYESGVSSAPPSAPSAPGHKVVAVDCEMVGTGPKGSVSALARCSIVSYHGDLVYDKYIRPANPVTDYRTKWSGIRREHLVNAIPFVTAQKEILKILHGKVVVGHAIHNDFKALGYFHPKEMTRDTSKITLLNRKAGFPEREMASLKRLAKQLLHKDIQTGRGGHSSVEDAKTTMELYRIVEAEYENELASGQAHL